MEKNKRNFYWTVIHEIDSEFIIEKYDIYITTYEELYYRLIYLSTLAKSNIYLYKIDEIFNKSHIIFKQICNNGKIDFEDISIITMFDANDLKILKRKKFESTLLNNPKLMYKNNPLAIINNCDYVLYNYLKKSDIDFFKLNIPLNVLLKLTNEKK